MSPSIGVNLRVTGHCQQGDRKYMEDVFCVAYQQTDDHKDLEFAFFGIFDGHGGKEAAMFAKDHLMDNITKQKQFWSEDDDHVLRAIKEGFHITQQAMWADLPNWKKTAHGFPSTAGTTASVCFIRRGKIFIGHCGDSGIILGEQHPTHPERWRARPLTTDHKPESAEELKRIEASGGKVMQKSGVARVVWYRPRGDHHGPLRRSTQIDEVPFLAVARALGDLWSYNSEADVFVVSPEPDVSVMPLDMTRHRCLILATDGAWNVLSPEMAVASVRDAEVNNEEHMLDPKGPVAWVNPSKRLVDLALSRWSMCQLRADNTTIVTVMLDPPGPPRAQVLRKMASASTAPYASPAVAPPSLPPKPCSSSSLSAPESASGSSNGIAIISRFPNSQVDAEKRGTNLVSTGNPQASMAGDQRSRIVHDSMRVTPHRTTVPSTNPSESVQASGDSVLSDEPAKLSPKSSPPPLPVRTLRRISEAPSNSSRSRKGPAPPPPVPARNNSAVALPARSRRSNVHFGNNSDTENDAPAEVDRRAGLRQRLPQQQQQQGGQQRSMLRPGRRSEPVLRRLAAEAAESSVSVVSSPARVLRPKQVNANNALVSAVEINRHKRKKRKSCDVVPSKMIKRFI